MTLKFFKTALILILILTCSESIYSQKLVESIAGIVGNEVIYLSDIENSIAQEIASGNRSPVDILRCRLYEEHLVTKLFLDQARIDSITVDEATVEGNLNMTLNRYIATAGSENALESYFNKSMIEIRQDIKKAMLDQQIVAEVQAGLTEDIKVTPADVRRYFSALPKDSLPKIPAMVEISIIQLDPPDNEQNKADARQRLLDLRSRILAGESFSTLALMYSEDTESAKKFGEIGYMARGELEKPYGDAVFSLNKNAVSRIVETRYGFHIIQLIDRMGDMVNSRHILIKPKVRPDQVLRATQRLDSIADYIRKDSISFEKAAMRVSTHKDSRINGGKFVKNDPTSRVTWFALEELDRETYLRVRDLKIGEISEPYRTVDENGNSVFRIVRLDNQVAAHEADPKTDYQHLYDLTLLQKRTNYFKDWVTKKIGITYIKISDEFKSCQFVNKGWMK